MQWRCCAIPLLQHICEPTPVSGIHLVEDLLQCSLLPLVLQLFGHLSGRHFGWKPEQLGQRVLALLMGVPVLFAGHPEEGMLCHVIAGH